VKGKGISFMENTFKYHNFAISEEEFAQAKDEILAQAAQAGNSKRSAS
jgi:hypothetical protein